MGGRPFRQEKQSKSLIDLPSKRALLMPTLALLRICQELIVIRPSGHSAIYYLTAVDETAFYCYTVQLVDSLM